MTREEKYNIAKWAMEHALNSGADAARVSISYSNSSQVEVRDEKIDKLEQANRSSMRISLYVDHRYSGITTNRLNNKEELGRFIQEAIAGTRHLSEDEFRTLPDPGLYYKGDGEDLKTVDAGFSSGDPQQKNDQAFAVGKEIAGQDERIISATTTYRDRLSGNVMVTSNGFEGDHESTSFSLAATVSVKDGDSRPQGYWSESSVFHGELIKEGIGKHALKRALDKLGQKKIKSGTMPMIVENRQADTILDPLISALSGSFIQQKNSFLIGMKGERIGSGLLTLVDDPFIISGRGSRLFDGEGLVTRKRTIVEEGILRDYFIDTYYGKKLDMEPTSGETTNLVFKPGELDLEGLMAAIGRGILVTGFNGGNSNDSTGDFSYGIEGFLVENGKLTGPVSEMNITGNFKQIWKDLMAVGNDVYTGSSMRLPSLAFDNISFSGI
jgi:PmbA protein